MFEHKYSLQVDLDKTFILQQLYELRANLCYRFLSNESLLSACPFKAQFFRLLHFAIQAKPAVFNFWHSGTLTLSSERQSARMSEMSEMKNGRFGLYGAERSKCNQMMTLDSKGISLLNSTARPQISNSRRASKVLMPQQQIVSGQWRIQDLQTEAPENFLSLDLKMSTSSAFWALFLQFSYLL